MRVAAVDIGTNSMRLFVADQIDGSLEEVERHSAVTRLGQGVDRERRLGEEPMRRTIEVLAVFGQRIADLGAERVRVVATSASRDAVNRKEFFDRAEAALGHRPELIPGDEEASLAFKGATLGSAATPTLVVDIGGGSTELVFGSVGPEMAVSIDIGSVRVTERAVPDRPAPPHQIEAGRELVAGALAGAVLPGTPERTIGVAGTITSLAAMTLRLAAYDPEVVHGSEVTMVDVTRLVEELSQLSIEKTAAAFPALDPGRAPVILGGAICAEAVLRYFGLAGYHVSESDMLDAIALSLVD
ncbi:MAG TPA: Ppx/GppA phosphatase family protein [Acidimicrobiia bacterium]|nr:Ppx/GppA phosphatase family protein [Acidimicrobiia bacterium]